MAALLLGLLLCATLSGLADAKVRPKPKAPAVAPASPTPASQTVPKSPAPLSSCPTGCALEQSIALLATKAELTVGGVVVGVL